MSCPISTEVRVKKYVKQFAIVNYGEIADFSDERYLSRLVYYGIKKMANVRVHLYDKNGKKINYNMNNGFLKCDDHKIPDNPIPRPVILRVIIPPHLFYKYGWEMSKTYQREINSILEGNAKAFMRTMVAQHYINYGNLDNAIYHFQHKYCFEEHLWQFEAIKKDLFRFGTPEKYDWENDNFTAINNYFLRILSAKRTITALGLEAYELDK